MSFHTGNLLNKKTHDLHLLCKIVRKFRNYLIYKVFCGESGIRTHGTLLEYTHFPGVLLRPLGHLS